MPSFFCVPDRWASCSPNRSCYQKTWMILQSGKHSDLSTLSITLVPHLHPKSTGAARCVAGEKLAGIHCGHAGCRCSTGNVQTLHCECPRGGSAADECWLPGRWQQVVLPGCHNHRRATLPAPAQSGAGTLPQRTDHGCMAAKKVTINSDSICLTLYHF